MYWSDRVGVGKKIYGMPKFRTMIVDTPAIAVSKWQAKLRAIEIAGDSGMHLTILRLATLYEEGDPGNLARLMRLIDRGRFIWVGDGSNRDNLIHR